MLCEMCHVKQKTRVKWCKYVCDDCEPKPLLNQLSGQGSTVNYKYYSKNNGNVSLARVNAFKGRVLAPDGKGEVVMKDKFGRITDRLARP